VQQLLVKFTSHNVIKECLFSVFFLFINP